MSEGTRTPRPAWLRKQKKLSPEVLKTLREIDNLGLHTICESARCPNLGECYQRGNATFLILGEHCTRNCGFCSVEHGVPTPPDPEEGVKIARYIRAARIRFAVITSVTRDDLPDGGAGHFCRVVADLRARVPGLGVELLVPDFGGRREPIETVAALPVQVFAHNVETVEPLYSRVRQGADYGRSLRLLSTAGRVRQRGVRLKSGIMVGLGESAEQLDRLFGDLAAAGVEILTIGQYLIPSQKNNPVVRYYNPEEFDELKVRAENKGIPYVLAGPYVRSSYLAEQAFRETREKKV